MTQEPLIEVPQMHIVSVGEYDDERIVGVWSTPEAAATQRDMLLSTEPKDYGTTYPVFVETWVVNGGRISREYFDSPEKVRAAQQMAADAIYQAKAERYGTPADGPGWIDNMRNRFKVGRLRP